MKLFEETKKADAHYYLDDVGLEIDRQELLEEMFNFNQPAYMLYVGEGFVPLRVAVVAWNESDAVEVMEDWARKTGRSDEIGEDDEYHQKLEQAFQKEKAREDVSYPEPDYQHAIQRIPMPVLRMEAE